MPIDVDSLLEMGIEPASKARYAAGRFGSMDQAMDWLFSPEGANWVEPPDPSPPPPSYDAKQIAPYVGGGPPNEGSSKDVRFAGLPQLLPDPDMPVEDDELNKALALSLAEAGGAPPSTPTDLGSAVTTPTPSAHLPPRPPTPGNPTIGPVNQGISNQTFGLVTMDQPKEMTEDETLKKALEDSVLTSSAHMAADQPPMDLERSPGAPVCLWTGQPQFEYAASVMQGLQAIPQIKVLMWNLAEDQPDHLKGNPMLELADGIFARMDVGDDAYSDMFKDEFPFKLDPAVGIPVEQSQALISHVQKCWAEYCDFYDLDIDKLDPWDGLARMCDDPERRLQLFISTGCHAAALLDPHPNDLVAKPNIEIYPSSSITTLYEAFAEQLWQPDSQNAFVQPAEILLMSVKYDHQFGPKVLFKIEEDFYIDRFLAGNSAVTAQYRADEGVLKGDQARLRERRQALTMVNGKDARQALVTALKYYTTVARPSGDAEKDASLANTRVKLEKVLAELDNELDSITSSLQSITDQQEKLFDRPELQKYKYELRAILYHDGLYGVGHTYSYVKEQDGKWWKITDGSGKVVETQEALGDSRGLHLGSGPYALFYSRAKDWPQELPRVGTRPNSISSFSDIPGSSAMPVLGHTLPDVGEEKSEATLPEPSSTTLTPGTSEMDIDPSQTHLTRTSSPSTATLSDDTDKTEPEDMQVAVNTPHTADSIDLSSGKDRQDDVDAI